MTLLLALASLTLFLFSGFVLAPMPSTNQNLSLFSFPVLLLSFMSLVGSLNALAWLRLRRTDARWRVLRVTFLAIASVILTFMPFWPLGWAYDLLLPLSRS